jgi:hypothetical protein
MKADAAAANTVLALALHVVADVAVAGQLHQQSEPRQKLAAVVHIGYADDFCEIARSSIVTGR